MSGPARQAVALVVSLTIALPLPALADNERFEGVPSEVPRLPDDCVRYDSVVRGDFVQGFLELHPDAKEQIKEIRDPAKHPQDVILIGELKAPFEEGALGGLEQHPECNRLWTEVFDALYGQLKVSWWPKWDVKIPVLTPMGRGTIPVFTEDGKHLALHLNSGEVFADDEWWPMKERPGAFSGAVVDLVRGLGFPDWLPRSFDSLVPPEHLNRPADWLMETLLVPVFNSADLAMLGLPAPNIPLWQRILYHPLIGNQALRTLRGVRSAFGVKGYWNRYRGHKALAENLKEAGPDVQKDFGKLIENPFLRRAVQAVDSYDSTYVALNEAVYDGVFVAETAAFLALTWYLAEVTVPGTIGAAAARFGLAAKTAARLVKVGKYAFWAAVMEKPMYDAFYKKMTGWGYGKGLSFIVWQGMVLFAVFSPFLVSKAGKLIMKEIPQVSLRELPKLSKALAESGK